MAQGRTVQLVIARTREPLAARACLARTFGERAIGLLGHRTLPDGEALVLERCGSIHTVGMRFPIDAVFVDRAWRVVALKGRLGPGRVIWPVRRAWGVVELAAGAVERVGLQLGDQLEVVP